MQFTSEKMIEKLSTEGDSVYIPMRLPPNLYAPKPKWSFVSQPVLFYDPEEHIDTFQRLQDAPIQSRESLFLEEEPEEKKSFE